MPGLAEALDRRYRIVTAHSTILRFARQPQNLPELVQFLQAARARDFGTFEIDHVDFVLNDWFMSHDKVVVLARYPLGGSS